jgi:thiol:disulfide interchange protein
MKKQSALSDQQLAWRKGMGIITSTVLAWLITVWALAYLWSIFPAWTQIPIVVTGFAFTFLALGFLMFGISELPDFQASGEKS